MANEIKSRTLPIETFVARLGGDDVTPGSGAAGAIAIALAAGCASKAIAITAKHRPLGATLAAALESLGQLREAALKGADADARDFRKFLRHPNGATADDLRQTDESLIGLCESLAALLDGIESEIHDSVQGDVRAARALLTAASTIHHHNKPTLAT